MKKEPISQRKIVKIYQNQLITYIIQCKTFNQELTNSKILWDFIMEVIDINFDDLILLILKTLFQELNLIDHINQYYFYFMYNRFKHQQQLRLAEMCKQTQQKYKKWVLDHESNNQFIKELKQHAIQKNKQRYDAFLDEQGEQPSVFEDDHYKIWRYNRQFRDVQDQSHFKGFKAFLHKPNRQINRFFNERQRKQISLNSSGAQHLVDSHIIPEQLRSRSLRSQGPLNPKIAFRPLFSDKQYLQPRLKHSNITDKERMLENSITFDDKFKKIYNSFQMTKSQIGKTKIIPIAEKSKQNLDDIQLTVSYVDKSQDFKYDIDNQQSNSPQISELKQQKPKEEKTKSDKKMNKTYFKMARTMALQGCQKSKQLMYKSQYNRKKDLSNIRRNINCEGFIKKPII